ncbi:MAG: four helix bundle protein [Chloroflexota bacterium]|jgi:four helix bundle protein
MQDFRKLVVWQRAHGFALSIYAASARFPGEERYGLTSQLRRAVLSIPANIAEGCGRETNGELRRFLFVARGSASEVDYFLLAARDLHMLSPADYVTLGAELEHIKRMLAGLIQKLTTDN